MAAQNESFRFSYPIEVRYGDVDAQGHVNHVRFLTYMEMARFKYVERIGVFRPGMRWDEVGMIVADAQCSYKAPLHFPAIVDVAVRMAEIGNKSFGLAYRMSRQDDGRLLAEGRTVQVAYDYRTGRSMRVPDDWRAAFTAFEQGA